MHFSLGLNSIPWYIFTTISFIHSSLHELLGFFLALAVANSAVMNAGVHIFSIMVFSGIFCMPSNDILEYVIAFLGGSCDKAAVCKPGDPRFYPWVRKSSWRREWPTFPVFLLGILYGQTDRLQSKRSQRVRHN